MMEFGHTLIYGQTNSGKTTLTQYLIDLLGVEDLFIFTTCEDYLEFKANCDNIFIANDEAGFEDLSKKIFSNKKYKKTSRNYVIFDDFN